MNYIFDSALYVQSSFISKASGTSLNDYFEERLKPINKSKKEELNAKKNKQVIQLLSQSAGIPLDLLDSSKKAIKSYKYTTPDLIKTLLASENKEEVVPEAPVRKAVQI